MHGAATHGDFAFDQNKAAAGGDARTTLMVRNIPNKYTQKAVLEELDVKFANTYDFFYLPIDFKNKCNVGYAFINLVVSKDALRLFKEFNGRRWTCFRSGKVCAITYARIQGKQAMIQRFQNSSLLNESLDG
ncbi:RNA binding-protein [Aureococcus anophagefferens]|nr:RNA binding-protein [Aureococcus anophagefferens]